MDEYWYHMELQQEGLVRDWFDAYWRLAMLILTEDEVNYLKRMTSFTPEKLQKIIEETKGKTTCHTE